MKFPAPAPGLVVRYAFLWKEDHDQGRYEAAKDRPCAIILAANVRETADIQVVVVPITHSAPAADERATSLEMPQAVARTLGLDAGRHWVRVTQLNRFIWPGYDLRPRPDVPERVDYGFIPEAFFERIRSAILAENKRTKISFIPRDS